MFIKITSKEEVPGFVYESYIKNDRETNTELVTRVLECKDVKYYTLYNEAGKNVAITAHDTYKNINNKIFFMGYKESYVGDVLFIHIINLDLSHQDIIGYGINLYIMNDHGKTIDSRCCKQWSRPLSPSQIEIS